MKGTKKKRLGLFSPRRLGSPPPELPNHFWILGLELFFVNVTLVMEFAGRQKRAAAPG
jgi:hypothetical protein